MTDDVIADGRYRPLPLRSLAVAQVPERRRPLSLMALPYSSFGAILMPLNIRRLPQKTRTITVPVETEDGEETITLTYKPDAFNSPGVLHEIDVINSPRIPAARRAAQFSDLLARIILSWDVTDDGMPYEPTADNISYLDITLIRGIIDALTQDRTAMLSGDVPALVTVGAQNGHSDTEARVLPPIDDGRAAAAAESPQIEAESRSDSDAAGYDPV